MKDFIPALKPLSALAFLGTGFLLFVFVAIALLALLRKSRWLWKVAGTSAACLLLCYSALLLAFSLTSQEVDLPLGAKKYFCELDCHLAYSVARVWTPTTVGGEANPISANGQFVVVELRVWFDPTTISPHRGNGLLTPNDRVVTLERRDGHSFPPSQRPEVLSAMSLRSTPMATPLRPGQSYVSYFVFETTANSGDLKLWLRTGDDLDKLLLGDELSPWHQRVFFLLKAGASSSRAS